MTTIAIQNGLVAVDSQLTGGSHVVRIQKLMRLPDGGVVTGAGAWARAYAGMCWVANGERGEPPDLDGAQVVIVRPDCSIWVAEEGWPAYPILGTVYTSGCGSDLARLLMSNGADPVHAVAEACEHDAFSSGPIYSMQARPVDEGLTIHEVKVSRKSKR